MKKTITLFLSTIWLVSCGSASHSKLAKTKTTPQPVYYPAPTVTASSKVKRDLDYENEKLNSVIDQWIGTPYKYAGNSRNGIDCSHFVCAILQEAFDFPSSFYFPSKDLANQGEAVKNEDLSVGDLVCFSINKNSKISHVGIYLGNGKFVHASTSKGVIISSLDEPYYRERFTTIRRVIDTTQYSSYYNP